MAFNFAKALGQFAATESCIFLLSIIFFKSILYSYYKTMSYNLLGGKTLILLSYFFTYPTTLSQYKSFLGLPPGRFPAAPFIGATTGSYPTLLRVASSFYADVNSAYFSAIFVNSAIFYSIFLYSKAIAGVISFLITGRILGFV